MTNSEDMTNLSMWMESIRSDGVVMANGEFEVEIRVTRSSDREQDLPELFRRMTIEDTVKVQFELDWQDQEDSK